MTRRRKLGILMVASPLLIGLVAWLGILWINHQAKQAWKDHRAAMEAQGVSFDWKDTIPDRVPDDENFALAPILQDEAVLRDLNLIQLPDWKRPKGFSGWRASQSYPFQDFYLPEDGDAIALLQAHYQEHEASFLALVEASKLPHSREGMDYDNIQDITGDLQGKLTYVLRALRDMANFKLLQNEPGLAHKFALSSLRIAKHGQARALIGHLIAISHHSQSVEPIWEGLARQVWNEDQLRDLETQLRPIDLLSDAANRIWEERAFANQHYKDMLENPTLMADTLQTMSDLFGKDLFYLSILVRFAPESLTYRNQLADDKLKARWIKISQHPDLLSEASAFQEEIESRKTAFLGHAHPKEALALTTSELYGNVLRSTLKVQIHIDLARVAIALERHRLAERHYPKDLKALTPRWLPAVPLDRINQEPLRYRIKEDGTIQLYSIGWNNQDDGGIFRKNDQEGDEVWQYTNP